LLFQVDTFYTGQSVLRERLAWFVTLPIAVIGCQSAHAVTNELFGSPESARSELLLRRGPGAGLVPLFACLALAVVVAGLAGRAAGTWSAHHAAAARLPFAVVAPALFVVQEHFETALRTGAAPIGTVVEPTFLPGLLLQIPIAIAGYAVARALVRLADGVRALVASRRRVPRRPAVPARHRPVPLVAPRSGRVRWAHSGRAPPARVLTATA
jgi:hypothetical protein